MKTVLFISHDSVLYGAPKSMLNIIDGLKDKVNFIVLVPYKGDLVDELRKRNVKVYISRYYWDEYFLVSFKDYFLIIYRTIRHYIGMFKTYRLIKKLHAQSKFDIIHSNSGVIRVGLIISKLLHIPHVWHIREFQNVDYHINILYGLSYFRKLLRKSERLICVSNTIRNYFELEDISEVIYNGVMSIPTEEIIFDKDNYFIFASNLSVEKGIFDVLIAFKTFAQHNTSIELLICGTGSTEITNSIQKYIEVENLSDRVKLLGYRNDVPSLLKHAKACIMASHHEAFGRTTAEAMMMGCPVIGKAAGGTLEIIQDKRFGFLYHTNEELLDCMKEISDSINIEHVNSMVIAAKERAFHLFSQEQLCDKVFNVYESIS